MENGTLLLMKDMEGESNNGLMEVNTQDIGREIEQI